MCEARVIIEGPEGEVVEELDGIATIVPEGERLSLTDLFGGRKSVKASFKEVRLLDHTVVLERSGG